MVLDHVLGDERVALARDHREMARRDLRVARHVDALDIDAGRDLPEHARLPRRHQVHRPAVEADDGDLVRLGLDRLEQLGGEIRPRRLEHGVALGRELGAHDLVQLDRQSRAPGRTARWRPGSSTRSNRPLRRRGALAVLHRHAQHQQVPVHGTSPSLASRHGAGRASDRGRGFRTRLPAGTAGRGLSLRGRRAHARSIAVHEHGGRTVNPASAQAVSAPAQSRSHGV